MPETYKNILVAVDGSDQSKKAFDEAVAIAKRNQSELHVLYVDEVSGSFYGDFSFSPKKIYEELLDVAYKEIEQFKQRAKDLDFSNLKTYIKSGSAKALIANFSKDETPVDLIVVGATGLNALERVLVGSTTSYVVTHAPSTVVVVK